jgi:hypothetical protein
MYVWHKIEVCLCDHCCSGKAISITQPECVYLACNVHVLGYFIIESRLLIHIMALVFCFLFILWCRKPQNTPFGLPGVMDEIWTRYHSEQKSNVTATSVSLVVQSQRISPGAQIVIKECRISLCVTKHYENYSSMLELWMCNWFL